MCIDAVHIVSEPAGVFAELRRVLRPGGRAVVSSWEARDRDNDALPEWVRRVDCAAWFAAAGFTDIAVVERPAWEQRERALWAEAAILDPAGDDAVASLRDEAIEVLPHVPLTRRVLASATAIPRWSAGSTVDETRDAVPTRRAAPSQRQAGALRANRQIVSNCSGVTGCTDNRDFPTSGMPTSSGTRRSSSRETSRAKVSV